MRMNRLILLCTALAAVLGSCGKSDGLAPNATITLLVDNLTCGQTGCQEIRVLGFPSAPVVVPAGPWKLTLGTVNTPVACLIIPVSAIANVTDEGTHKTTSVKWSASQKFALAATKPEDNVFAQGATTPEFVPAQNAGWLISLPGNGVPVKHAACTP